MKETTKKDYLDIYVNATLNEIKNKIIREINIEEKRMLETDKVMTNILLDLINKEPKNLQKDSEGNFIYTLLPLSDNQEHQKIRDTLTFLYAAIYFNNVSLLKKLQSSNVNLIYYDNLSHYYDRLALSLLDNTITSCFNEDEYIKILKNHHLVFDQFYQTVIKKNSPDKSHYLERFVKIIKEVKIPLNTLSVKNLFRKDTMSLIEDETYLLSNEEELKFISRCLYSENIKLPENKIRLNKLLQTNNFDSYCVDYDIVFKLFSDEEIMNIPNLYSVSWYFHQFIESEELLNKAYDLYKKYPEIVNIPSQEFNFDLIKIINNDILILLLKANIKLNISSEQLEKLITNHKIKKLVKQNKKTTKKGDK